MGICKNYKNLTNEEVEKIAIEKLSGVKLYDNLYIIPGNIVDTKEINEEYVSEDFLTDVVMKKLDSLNLEDGDSLTIICEAEFDDIKKVIEIVNLRNDISIELNYEGTLDHVDREILVNTIAKGVENKEIIVSYYLPYDLKGLKNIIISMDIEE